jgi:hypothetical protein
MLINTIEGNQEKLLTKKEQLEEMIEKSSSPEDVFKVYKEKIDRILNFDEFDRMTVESLIDKVIVTEDKKNKEKKVDIFYKFQI